MTRRLLFTLCAALLVPGAAAQTPEMDRLDVFVGTWDLRTRDIQPDGSYREGRARSTVYSVLDGVAQQDDFRQVNAEGVVTFRGTSIRSYNASAGHYLIVWVMPGVDGITTLRGWFEGEDLVMQGSEHDPYGAFREEARYTSITDSTYAFTMRRSYDDGKTWLDPFGEIEATRVPDP